MLFFLGKKIKAPKTLLNWKVVHEKMPWNIILLLGGGYALAKGSEVNIYEEASWRLSAQPFCYAVVVFSLTLHGFSFFLEISVKY